MKRLFLLLILLVSSVNLAFAENHAESPVDLPAGYTLIDSVISEKAAMLLIEQPDGTCSFWGCQLTDGGWEITQSTSLPSDTGWDDYHAGKTVICIDVPFSDVWVGYVIELQQDGRWLVTSVVPEAGEAFDFHPNGIAIDITGMLYGNVAIQQDISKIEWNSFPKNLNEAVCYLDDDWGVIGEPNLPLYADWGCTQMLGTYLYGTPVHVLELTYEIPENIEGLALAQVSIAGSDIVGWMPAYGLFTGAEQLWTAEDENGEYEYTASWDAPNVAIAAGTPIYATPNGSVESKSDWDTHLQVLSRQEEWVFVLLDEYDLLTGYVRSEACEFDQ